MDQMEASRVVLVKLNCSTGPVDLVAGVVQVVLVERIAGS